MIRSSPCVMQGSWRGTACAIVPFLVVVHPCGLPFPPPTCCNVLATCGRDLVMAMQADHALGRLLLHGIDHELVAAEQQRILGVHQVGLAASVGLLMHALWSWLAVGATGAAGNAVALPAQPAFPTKALTASSTPRPLLTLPCSGCWTGPRR